jgi:hypothetical protein
MRVYFRTNNGRFAAPSTARHAWTESGREIHGAAKKAAARRSKAKPRPKPRPAPRAPRPVADVSPVFKEFVDPAGIDGVSGRSTRQVYALVQFWLQDSKFIYRTAKGFTLEEDDEYFEEHNEEETPPATPIIPFKLPRESVAYWRAQSDDTIIAIVEAAAGEEIAWILDDDGNEVKAYHGLEVKKTHNDCRAAGRKLARKRARVEKQKAAEIGRVWKNVTKTDRPHRAEKVRRPNKSKGSKRRK